MKNFNVTRLAVLGLGLGVAVLGAPESVKAATVVKGTDYLESPAGSGNFVTINGIGTIPLKGLPFSPLNTDTTVERQADCVFASGTCTIPIQMTNLSLTTVAPVTINSVNYDLFVKIAPGTLSTGTMTINENNTFSSILNLDWQVLASLAGSGPGSAVCLSEIAGLTEFDSDCSLVSADQLTANSTWSPTPAPDTVIVTGPRGDQAANLHTGLIAGESDFFLVGNVDGNVEHNHRDFAAKHTVRQAGIPVPEPSAVLGSLLGLGAMLKLRRKVK